MQHTILFTVIPSGISLNQDKLPVSIVVSPRLSGADLLGKFPDWLNWTQNLKRGGMSFTVRCGTRITEVKINTEVLQPELWEKLFNKETLVRPFAFEDYSERGIYSYSVRQALSSLKETYQKAGVELALPDTTSANEERGGLRGILDNLVKGYEVNWNDKNAKRYRERFRRTAHSQIGKATYSQNQPFARPEDINEDGLYKNGKITAANKQALAAEFSTFHRQPQPEKYSRLKDTPPDYDKMFDFHQALTSISSYPALQRALGLVFDVVLPADVVPATTTAAGENMSIIEVRPGWDWRAAPKTPKLETAYWHIKDNNSAVFTTAPEPNGSFEMLGLLNLTETHYGLAQVDVDGGMQKMIRLAESMQTDNPPEEAQRAEVFDNTATLASLRSGGISLFADARAQRLLARFGQSKDQESQLTAGNLKPFHLQDLVKGYRLDIWDDVAKTWRSLHQRDETYLIGGPDGAAGFKAPKQEGFVQLSATRSSAEGAGDELYLHESVARWAGWSLSAPLPGIALSSDTDPANALDDEEKNPAVTPFKIQPIYRAVPGTLPSLRFGRRYALRARVVDLAGNSLAPDDVLAAQLATFMGTPNAGSQFPYLRFEPVDAPIVVIRDPAALTSPGSELLRIVIRSFNDGIANDGIAPDLTANDRFVLPPRTSVEMAERLGMIDDTSGKLRTDAVAYQLLADRDGAELDTEPVTVAGADKTVPIVRPLTMTGVPYLPDVLARGAALRNLPGAAEAGIGKVASGTGTDQTIGYEILTAVNPRPGSATMVSFETQPDWTTAQPFRIGLTEGDVPPLWNATDRMLTVLLPKGVQRTCPLSSYLLPEDLEKMGQWKWLKEYIDFLTSNDPEDRALDLDTTLDRIQHILQRSVEGGLWMLMPPQLITFVHAVQQPLGQPAFEQILVQRGDQTILKTMLEQENGPVNNTETNIVTAWRAVNSVSANLIGALRLHLPSSAKVDFYAEWSDMIDDLTQPAPTVQQRSDYVDEIPLQATREGMIYRDGRYLGYLIPDENLIVFGNTGDEIGNQKEGRSIYGDAAPRHLLNDTKHHLIHYKPVATSRYKEYFEASLDFTRAGSPLAVHVPASARPVAPEILYIVPTFGWQRQTETSIKRSVRFGGGLRVYLSRPWFSSGDGELLGVLTGYVPNYTDTEIAAWKPFISQWGGDPIWQQATGLSYFPSQYNFKDSVASDYNLSLEEKSAPGLVNVSGYEPKFDPERQLWYCDLTVDCQQAYMPFIRLALARYQPFALQEVKLSKVVTADFIQLMPNRSLVLIPDAFKKSHFRFNVSGPIPDGPMLPELATNTARQQPVALRVSIQVLDPMLGEDLGWSDVPATVATVQMDALKSLTDQPNLKIWSGNIIFADRDPGNRYRAVFEEREYYMGDSPRGTAYPSRVVYVETVEV